MIYKVVTTNSAMPLDECITFHMAQAEAKRRGPGHHVMVRGRRITDANGDLLPGMESEAAR